MKLIVNKLGIGYTNLLKLIENRKERARYLSDFSYADLFTDYIKFDEIGLLN